MSSGSGYFITNSIARLFVSNSFSECHADCSKQHPSEKPTSLAIFRVNGRSRAAPSAAGTETLCSPRYRGRIERVPISLYLLMSPSYVRFLTTRSITSRNEFCATLIYTPRSLAATRGRGKKNPPPLRLSSVLNEETIDSYRWSIMCGIYI